MNLENLVCLMKDAASYLKVVDLASFSLRHHIEIDLEAGTWKFARTAPWIAPGYRHIATYYIGSSVRTTDAWAYPYELIGIYDRTNASHLSSMASEAYNYGHGPRGWDDE